MKVLAINPGMNSHWRELANGPVRSVGVSHVRETILFSVEGRKGIVYQVEVNKEELMKVAEHLKRQ